MRLKIAALSAALLPLGLIPGALSSDDSQTAKPPVVTLAASLPEVYQGETLTVRWSSEGASECHKVSGPGWAEGDKPLAGEERVGPVTAEPGTTLFYQVACSSGDRPADKARASLNVRVVPVPDTTGTRVFDTSCAYTHTANDDPLVHPGAPGAAHLHEFFGNASTDADTTFSSMEAANAATPGCKDTLDGAAYWVPALYMDGVRQQPNSIHVYYRGDTSSLNAPLETTLAFPPGFGMIARRYGFACGDASGHGTEPTPCPEKTGHGNANTIVYPFPNHWDCVRLFSMDGSHVSYKKDAAHPCRIPDLTMIVNYGRIYPDTDTAAHEWTVAFTPDGGVGPLTTLHADFFDGWDAFHLDHLTHLCLNTSGNGRLCHDDTAR